MNLRTTLSALLCAWLVVPLLTLPAAGAEPSGPRAEEFRTPPQSARPLTWWHWLDGNIDRAGVTADLESMKRAGLGGVYMFNAGIGMPQGNVRFMQEPWLAMIDHVVKEATRLGLVFGIHNCDGFSQSGGPWITAETSMKQLTWTTRDVTGPARFDAVLDRPEAREDFYRDAVLIAYPVPEGGPLTGAKLRGTLRPGEPARLTDGDPKTVAVFPPSEKGHTIDFVFAEPRTVRSVVCRNADPHKWEEDFPIRVQVSSDGHEFRTVGTFTANWDMAANPQITAACDETTGRVFRLAFANPWRVSFGEIELSSAARVHFAEAKATRARSRGHGGERRHYDAYPGPDRHRALAPSLTVARSAVQDLTGRMASDGRLAWDVPPGRWRIVRMGFTSNGHYVSPATAEGRGLECDKLDPKIVRYHLDQYVGKLLERAGPGHTFAAMEVDSWECGIQNWTAGLEKRFRQQVGYDLVPFLPALLEGWIVENADVTERALWDWRRFLADQFSESYFSVVAAFAREKHLTYVSESTGRQAFHYDAAYARHGEVPMGEFWIDQGPGQGVRVDCKLSASIAHTTGQRIVASESYTAGPRSAAWQNHPFRLKAEGDRAFCAGINEFVFHTFAHQPYPVTGPGFTFASWGLNFNRANTWWEAAGPWIDYLTRCNYLLREGQPVADVLWYIGEDVPNRIGWGDELRPALPAGYDFDGCDTTALLGAKVVDGQVVLASGARYRVLLLPNLPTMRPAVLEKVAELARAGATLLGPRPQQSPSLRDLGPGDAAVCKLAGELWNGRVADGVTFEQLFQRIGLTPDFAWKSALPDAEILYVHRRIGGAEVYFVSNQRDRAETVEAVFRAGNRAPQWWDPATGEIRDLPEFRVADGRVTVPLRFDPCGSAFLVFGAPRPAARGRNWPEYEVVQPVTEAWQVRFAPNLGASEAIRMDRLVSLSDRPEPGVKFFSGTATYTCRFECAKLPARSVLDLGDVQVIAALKLNGRDLGLFWKPPFHVDVTGVLKAGTNELEVRVTTLWPNRMIGDAALPDDVDWRGSAGKPLRYPAAWPSWLVEGKPRPSGRIAFCTRKDVYRKDDPLQPSGLIGPVTVQAVKGDGGPTGR